MQVHWDIPIDEKSVPAEKELADIDAFIEAQLRTGVLLDADEWQPSATAHASDSSVESSRLLRRFDEGRWRDGMKAWQELVS